MGDTPLTAAKPGVVPQQRRGSQPGFVASALTTAEAGASRASAPRGRASLFSAPVAAAAAAAQAVRTEAVPASFVPLVEMDDPNAHATTREQAHATGFSAGFAAGSREAAKVARVEAEAVRQRTIEAEATRAAEHAQAMQALAAAVQAVRATEVPVLEEAEQRLHTAALELATAVLGVELADAETSAKAALARIASTGAPTELVVRMSPRDADAVGVPPTGMTIVADPSLPHGDALAEHPFGAVDACLSNALARAKDVLDGLAHPITGDVT
jgi:flagellar assembly protein FliH